MGNDTCDWGYCDHNGPQVWPQKFPIADSGRRQSPIDIETDKCLVVREQPGQNELTILYPTVFPELTVQNSGYGWKVDIPEQLAKQSVLSGGPLAHTYQMAQFHCHWGKHCGVGSEHTVNGKSYAAELHFVHWNTGQFDNPLDAMMSTNGLAVLGVFLDIGEQSNDELDKLLEHITLVRYKGEKCDIAHNVDITKLLPENKSYWTYTGSLTTPPLSESVTWIVFSNPILCTEDQISRFRDMCFVTRDNSLTAALGGQLVENHRHTQPLYDRTVTFVQK
ncbi:carbonic anhydrase 2-like [Oppia nitens]|uniref:carbonic anhydrase 2-like n=1 Tax=Oppia nitens TaxID=1686743 RepID=UPI0023DA1A79|nr:carbonic anhydrase 2-like [Oppia nitens]